MIQLDGSGAYNLTHNMQFLDLAEVVVTGTFKAAKTNLALHRPASQSSTYAGLSFSPAAGLAVDGNTDGNFYHRSVTHTAGKGADWWQTDLGASKSIDSVNVFNRTDWASSRLSDYWVFVSNTPFNTALTPAQQAARPGVWSSHQTSAPSPSRSIRVGGSGRYVMIQENTKQVLSLAEVQVMG